MDPLCKFFTVMYPLLYSDFLLVMIITYGIEHLRQWSVVFRTLQTWKMESVYVACGLDFMPQKPQISIFMDDKRKGKVNIREHKQ
jgi:hypothetical protein